MAEGGEKGEFEAIAGVFGEFRQGEGEGGGRGVEVGGDVGAIEAVEQGAHAVEQGGQGDDRALVVAFEVFHDAAGDVAGDPEVAAAGGMAASWMRGGASSSSQGASGRSPTLSSGCWLGREIIMDGGQRVGVGKKFDLLDRAGGGGIFQGLDFVDELLDGGEFAVNGGVADVGDRVDWRSRVMTLLPMVEDGTSRTPSAWSSR